MPLESLEFKVKIYEKLHQQRTYALYSLYGWHIGPPFNLYICYICYNINTGRDTTLDTKVVYPEFMRMISLSSIDMNIHATEDLSKTLQMSCPESLFQVG